MAKKPQITPTDYLHAFALAEPFCTETKDKTALMAEQQGMANIILDAALHAASEGLSRLDAAEAMKWPVGYEDPKHD